MKMPISRGKRRNGQMLIISAAALVAVCGFTALAVDYGIMTNDANRMQRTCDAAALAGVQELKKNTSDIYNRSMAIYVAKTTALANNVVLNDSNIQVSPDYRQITVSASTTRNFLFARVLGRDSQLISRRAAARVSNATGVKTTGPGRAAPMGITKETYDLYKNDYQVARTTNLPIYRDITVIRANTDEYGLNDLALFDLRDTNAKSPEFFERQLSGEEVEQTYIMDQLRVCSSDSVDCENTINAAQSSAIGKMKEGIGKIFLSAFNLTGTKQDGIRRASPNDDDWQIDGEKALGAQLGTEPVSNPRIISLLINQGRSVPRGGTFDTPVLGYAPVYVQDMIQTQELDLSTGKMEDVYKLRVAFLAPLKAPEGTDHNDNAGELSGMRVTRLVE